MRMVADERSFIETNEAFTTLYWLVVTISGFSGFCVAGGRCAVAGDGVFCADDFGLSEKAEIRLSHQDKRLGSFH